ncbi:MAG: CCA tRNA nucleotidyltransferase [DPANN group archaeon]|nr:CCA tRNA nucleotidyltransferase [DPANN group archaeon]
MEEYVKLIKNVLDKIKPTNIEIKKNKDMYSKIKEYIESKFKKNVLLVGSVGKKTFISGDNDLDIFVFFNINTTKDTLEKEGLDIGKDVFKKFKGQYTINYAEHPYVKGTINGFKIEIVPAYNITSTEVLKSAVDRTPFHTQYVLDNLKNQNDVLLLKQFLKGIECYGSDLKTLGFSGYLCELIILKYKTFENTLKIAQSWTYQEIIDLENHHTNEFYNKIKQTFKDQPLIFIDPTDKKRNVAAVLSKEKFSRFIFMARMFLDEPKNTFFFPKKIKINKEKIINDLKLRKTKLIVIIFKKPNVVEDILYPQLRRFKQRTINVLEKEGFNILNAHEFADDDCGISIETHYGHLEKFKETLGPRIFDPLDNQEKFTQKHKTIWFKEDRFISEIERKHCKIEDFIKNWLKQDQFNLEKEGVPRNIAESISKRFKIIQDNNLIKIKSDELWKAHLKEKIKVY